MKVIGDLQLHSKYSRAVSQRMNIEELFFWSQMKGVGLIATGDWTHPLWIREIKEKLTETGRGTLRLKSEIRNSNIEIRNTVERLSGQFQTHETEFLLATELSSIYTQGGQTRRVHNLLWVPSLSSAEKITKELLKRGCNLAADGRPIIGLTSKELLQIALEVDESSLVIPAHAWTPWFALFGSKSGFDSIEECFGDMSEYVYAIETGLSSDPGMNWRIPELDNRSIVSFSDAHSGPKLGREATVFAMEEISYRAVREAIMDKSPKNRISCTFEFYPEEGKYHFDGHRNCNYRQTPEETRKRGIICPVCRRPLTVGVEYRIEELAQREPITVIVKNDDHGVRWSYHPDNTHPPFTHLVPLLEIIAEIRKVGSGSKRVQEEYQRVIMSVGPEFHVLLKADFDTISRASDERLSRAIKKVRSGAISVDPGYDGVFGTVTVWSEGEDPDEAAKSKEQIGLF